MNLTRISMQCCRFRNFSPKIVISSIVQSALDSKKGVVALESTVITHGLPYPQNMETAKLLENTVRREGSVPATIAILDGKIHIGLNDEELARVAGATHATKVSRRDIAHALCKKFTEYNSSFPVKNHILDANKLNKRKFTQ
ncbi:hypothetical protein KIN20_030891 [Parelaphostrongylus tenuis]|uniref:Pseudouridine-5'-phosphate glycosidase n=1 Tax=Parelaphostrongylus tenuis TaxID=148309 RepID=A0AAD5R4G5_PARTN|nr:hypothetical protein KIN20_030891 [Parelaphostrongylus tenuis]